MTPYKVQWSIEAIEVLFQIWIVARDVGEIGAAPNKIEAVLAGDPEPPRFHRA